MLNDSLRVVAGIGLGVTNCLGCCNINTDDINKVFQDDETPEEKKRIVDLVVRETCDYDQANDINNEQRKEIKKALRAFDRAIDEGEKEIDKNNPYVTSHDSGYYKKLQSKNGVEEVYEEERSAIEQETSDFIVNLRKCLRSLVSSPLKFKSPGVNIDGEVLGGHEGTFEEIRNSFLDKLKAGRTVGFRFISHNGLADDGGPGRQLMSTFYQNLLSKETAKLWTKVVNEVDYVVFGNNIDSSEAFDLGKLVFLSLTRDGLIEYNFPEVYYKIMLHVPSDKLEDYLTLADFKNMIGIMHESKDGSWVRGEYLIPVNIKVNPNKDSVLLKYAKEEVYKIYLRLCPQVSAKKFEEFNKNFETEVASLMFAQGVKIKEVLEHFVAGINYYCKHIMNLSSYENIRFLNEYLNSFWPIIFCLLKIAVYVPLRQLTDIVVEGDHSILVFPGSNGRVYATFEENVYYAMMRPDSEQLVCGWNFFPLSNPANESHHGTISARLLTVMNCLNPQVCANILPVSIDLLKQELANIFERRDKPSPTFLELLKRYKFRPKDLKLLLEGEPVTTIEDLMTHFSLDKNYNNFNLDDVKEIIESEIKEKYQDKKTQIKFFENIFQAFTGSKRCPGMIKISLLGDIMNAESIVHTCFNSISLNKTDPKNCFRNLIQEKCTLEKENFDFNFI